MVTHTQTIRRRIIYSEKQPSYEAFLEKDGSVSINNRNFQILAIELYKLKDSQLQLQLNYLNLGKNKIMI